MRGILRYCWFVGIVRPIILLVMGVNVRNRAGLGAAPAIVVANHNSHLDTMVLVSLFPSTRLARIRPVAAADYFLSNRFFAWFALHVIGIIPLERGGTRHKADPLAACSAALDRGDILLLFPEGSRGEPERLAAFKTGVAHLAQRHPQVPVIPVYLQGLGKALPRGECLLVPVICDVAVGAPLYWSGTRNDFMDTLQQQMQELAATIQRPILE